MGWRNADVGGGGRPMAVRADLISEISSSRRLAGWGGAVPSRGQATAYVPGTSDPELNRGFQIQNV